MRILAKKSTSEDSDVNVSPLIDMVFILLIFFIVTTVFVDEQGMAIETPIVGPTPPEDGEPFVMSIRSNGSIYFDEEEKSLSQLRGIIERERRRENRRLTLEVNEEVSTSRMIAVMDRCKLHGVAGVSVKSIP